MKQFSIKNKSCKVLFLSYIPIASITNYMYSIICLLRLLCIPDSCLIRPKNSGLNNFPIYLNVKNNSVLRIL